MAGKRVMLVIMLGAMLACSPAASPSPERTAERDPGSRKQGPRHRRDGQADSSTQSGGVELAAFAQRLQDLTVAGDAATLEALFLDPTTIRECAFSRPKTREGITAPQVSELLSQRRARVQRVRTPLPGAKVVALVHKMRPRNRLLGAKVDGASCPLEARGRVNVVVHGEAPPPDVVENRYEAAYVGGRWWLVSYERSERDCSDLGAPEAFGCRALHSPGARVLDEDVEDDDGG
jgi:hypothetical protein